MKLTPNRSVENFGRPYIIAELGSNHNGDMDLARKLILAAKEAGADCVKFQSWSKETIFSRKKYDDNYFIADDYRSRKDFTLEEIVAKYAISEKQLLEMRDFCRTISIDFASTPFSPREIDYLVDTLEAPFIKVASMDVNNYPLLDRLARKQRPVVLATGLSELHELDKAVRTIEKAGNSQIILLHCIAIYPPKDEEVHLARINTLRTLYPAYPVGFSDHTMGSCIPTAAVALGACVIEKHFTLDKEMFGWDHKISANPTELKQICENALRVWKAVGSTRMLPQENTERREEFRRSIVCLRSLKKGDVVQRDDLDCKRPGTGIAPEHFDLVVGRTAKRDVRADYPLQWEDFV